MHIIEPCCVQRQLADLRKAIKNGGRKQINGYGDLSLTELLPALLTGYNETELLIAAPSVPDQAAEVIKTWAKWQWARVDGSGKFYVLTHLTVIADLSEEKSPMVSGWLKGNPFGDRLTLVDKAQDDTALLLPDIAFTGPLNMRYGGNFVCDVTTVQEEVDALWKQYSRLARRKQSGTSAATAKQEQTQAETESDADVTDAAPAPEQQSDTPHRNYARRK